MTAKELARRLNLSAAAISMALNDKPGVSDETRRIVLTAAQEHGFVLPEPGKRRKNQDTICFVMYRREGAVVGDTQFFSLLIEGIEAGVKIAGYKLRVSYVHKADGVEGQLAEISYSNCAGIILLGTEMIPADYAPFAKLRVPLVLLDVYFDTIRHNSVLINNVQGAFLATDYLISRVRKQPGYLHSSYAIPNFDERADGFYKAIRKSGMSTSKSIVHRLTPDVEGACADMLELMAGGEELASCYFADNDLIAIGAMKALQARGIKIPEDISIIGFDNIPSANYVNPPLTTVNVPKQYMGEMATRRLVEVMDGKEQTLCKLAVATTLVVRKSVV